MIRALLFDFDGLILDTEMPDYRAWQEIYSEHGATLSLVDWGKIIGGTGLADFDAVTELEKQTGRRLDRDALNARWRVRGDELIAALPILPGVETILKEAKKRGLRLAVASSSLHEWVDTHLKRLGLWDHFEAVICRDDVQRTKPDPELFLKALKAVDAQPEEALIFEDSPNGILAGKAAGVRVVAVPNELTAQLVMPAADLKLHSLADLTLDEMLLRFNAVLRQELPADITGIRQVNRSAFPGEAEARLVDLLRERGRSTLSLVTVNGDQVIAHCQFSEVTLDPGVDGLRGVGLGPVAVLPEFQKKGFGSRLIEAGVKICRERGYDFVVLLGDPRYYCRFGFIPAAEFGLDNDYHAGDEFQARELKPGSLRGVRACVHYAGEFNESEC